jgi:hypothetical protein
MKFPVTVVDVMDIGKGIGTKITEGDYQDPSFMNQPSNKLIVVGVTTWAPAIVFQAFKYARVGAIGNWADDVVRESWMDDLMGFKPKNKASKKLLAKFLLKAMPVIGWAFAIYDIYLIYEWIDEQLSSPNTSASGQGRKNYKQMRSTANKYSRRKYYA